MFASTTLSMVFTVVYVVTGVYSLARLAQLMAEPDDDGDRLVELFHLAMSLAMIAMAWAWTGGPDTAGGMVQVVVFGAFTAWFLHSAVTRATTHGQLTNGYHVVMGAAMTWMVAAMPLMMGGSSGGMDMSGHAGHAGHHAAATTSGTDAPATMAPAPGWVVAVTVVFVALLVAAAGWWADRAIHADDPGPQPTGAVATRTATSLAIRIEPSCHLLMSLGMAGMLLAML